MGLGEGAKPDASQIGRYFEYCGCSVAPFRFLADMGHARRRPKRLAGKLRQIRKALRMSQQEMAQGLGHRLEAPTISRYECGRNMPPLELLLAYSRIAGVSMEQIIDDEKDLTL